MNRKCDLASRAAACLTKLVLFTVCATTVFAQPAPREILGFTPGDDYKLAHWDKIVEYFKALDAASDRVVFKEIGKTTMGKPFTYALISSPQNLRRIDHYIEINDKLADPRMINRSSKEAAKLFKRGKVFVLITHGIHSTEVGSTLSSTLIAHRLATSDDKRIRKILDEAIVVMVPSLNPDGVDIIKDWYDKTVGTKFEGTRPPKLYHKYVGHDNNRDWYAFTQVETQLTVEKIHNVFHPQIVHDIHQQGQNGARFFVPPYLEPVEPNVPGEIIEGYTEIGNYIAGKMRKEGLKGITTASTYDAWTPARAYSHYHGGARILSETASARLASPIDIKFEDMVSRRGFDVTKESDNYGPLWKGGKWTLRDITNYMTTGAFHLLDHASENRKKWLERFYKIGFDATRPGKEGESSAYVFKIKDNGAAFTLRDALRRGGVEITPVKTLGGGTDNLADSYMIDLAQPYAAFARAMINPVTYPNLMDDDGKPIPPYDVTAHNLAMLHGVEVEQFTKPPAVKEAVETVAEIEKRPASDPCAGDLVYGALRLPVPSMDEGWTRWVFEKYGPYMIPNSCDSEAVSVKTHDLTTDSLSAIVFPDQSPNQILNGYKEGTMPEAYVGGLGSEGVSRLREFVEKGGTLVFLNRSSDFAIEQFELPVENIAKEWKNKDFFIPGSILKTELDTSHAIARGIKPESIAWFERSPVFELRDGSDLEVFARVIARYPDDPEKILLSGWALGKEKIAGKAALVEVRMGRGKIVLFGFRPQYRGQSLATFPLLFNAITY